jgi:hypothetical protein
MVLSGGGRLGAPDAAPVELTAGSTVLLPAALERAEAGLAASTTLLRITVRSPLHGLIA